MHSKKRSGEDHSTAVANASTKSIEVDHKEKRQSDIFPAFSILGRKLPTRKTMDGLNAHFFSLDEWHEARTRKVYDVMKQSQSAKAFLGLADLDQRIRARGVL